MATGKEMSARDLLRAKIFASENRKFKRETCTLFGAEVEIRQPSFGDILEAQNMEDRAAGAFFMIIKYCVVPGTDTPVFEDTDIEILKGLPFGNDLLKFNEAFVKLTNITVMVDDATKNLLATPGEKQHGS